MIGDETSIGDETYIKKDVKVWPRKVIESGSIVTTNLIWGEKWRKSLFEGAIVRGVDQRRADSRIFRQARRGLWVDPAQGLPSFLPGATPSALPGCSNAPSSAACCRPGSTSATASWSPCRFCATSSPPSARSEAYIFASRRKTRPRPKSSFFDAEGNEIPSSVAKGIERIFFKENFRRVHYSDPGGIWEIPRILRLLPGGISPGARRGRPAPGRS